MNSGKVVYRLPEFREIFIGSVKKGRQKAKGEDTVGGCVPYQAELVNDTSK